MKNTFIILMVAALAVACSSKLQVKVDIIKRDQLMANSAFKALLPPPDAIVLSQEVTSALIMMKQEVPGFVEKMYSISNKLEKGKQEEYIDGYKAEFDKALNVFLAEIEKTLNGHSTTTIALEKLKSKLESIRSDIEGKFNRDEEKAKVNQVFEITFSKLYNKAVSDAQTTSNLLGDPLASFIATAPDSMWSNYVGQYNLAKAKTKLGNSDIAIAMEDPGNYVIKGVRLDPSDVIKASFKTIKAGLSIIAASQGVNNGTTDDGQIINYTLAADSLRLTAAMNEKLYKQSARELLNVIAQQQQAIGEKENAPLGIDIINTQLAQFKKVNNIKEK